LASIHPDGTPHEQYRFVQRNRPLAALTFATLVVQRGHKSGAGYTTSAARRLGRDVLAVPDAPWSTAGGGFGVELSKGAEVIWDGEALRRYLAALLPRIHGGAQLALGGPPAPRVAKPPPPQAAPRQPPPDPSQLDESSRRTLACLSEVPQHADALCGATGLAYRELSHALFTLCMEGLVLEAPLGHYRLPP
jgi:predicted Rossmann fold nucleotide-binding protein DprA/Smf involved in DNA uptake